MADMEKVHKLQQQKAEKRKVLEELERDKQFKVICHSNAFLRKKSEQQLLKDQSIERQQMKRTQKHSQRNLLINEMREIVQ